jgi:hypothetical protein
MSRRRLDANGRPTHRTATAAEEAGAIPPPWCGGRLHRIVRLAASRDGPLSRLLTRVSFRSPSPFNPLLPSPRHSRLPPSLTWTARGAGMLGGPTSRSQRFPVLRPHPTPFCPPSLPSQLRSSPPRRWAPLRAARPRCTFVPGRLNTVGPQERAGPRPGGLRSPAPDPDLPPNSTVLGRGLTAGDEPPHRTATSRQKAGAIRTLGAAVGSIALLGCGHVLASSSWSNPRLHFLFPSCLACPAPLPSPYHVTPLPRNTSRRPGWPRTALPLLSSLFLFDFASIDPNLATTAPCSRYLPRFASHPRTLITHLPHNFALPPCAKGRVAQGRNPCSLIRRAALRALAFAAASSLAPERGHHLGTQKRRSRPAARYRCTSPTAPGDPRADECSAERSTARSAAPCRRRCPSKRRSPRLAQGERPTTGRPTPITDIPQPNGRR